MPTNVSMSFVCDAPTDEAVKAIEAALSASVKSLREGGLKPVVNFHVSRTEQKQL